MGYYLSHHFSSILGFSALSNSLYDLPKLYGSKGWNPAANLVGLDNYFAIFRNPLFLKSISNTFILWGVNFVPQIGLALLLAAWFTNIKLRLRGKAFQSRFTYPTSLLPLQ